MTWSKATTKAIARSLDIYYRDAARTKRMDRLNAVFVRAGDLAFDIGAHVGDRTASFRRLGATVVAVEPQPAVFRALRWLHGRDPRVDLYRAAVGETEGTAKLYVNSANPTTSTLSRDLVQSAPSAAAWRDQTWDDQILANTTTLDQLIATHGQPNFVKIDVEGHEADVLRGLHYRIPALSFEFTTLQRCVAQDALRILEALGPYRFNYSLGETHSLALSGWSNRADMWRLIDSLPDDANSGDIFARLNST